ncbi:MAG: elongation factor P [bacterium]
MNININDIKNGMSVIIDNNLFLILEFQHVKPGKGPAFVRIKLKNLRTGSTIEETFNTNIKVTKAHIEKVDMQYLYSSGDNLAFMNNETYDQIEISKTILKEQIPYIKEGMNISIEYFESEIIGVNLPEKVEYLVIESAPAVKGNTTTNTFKDAKIETGYTVKVPLFINEGETIVISTKDGSYSGRA